MDRVRNILRTAGFFLISVLIIGLTFFFLEQSIIKVETPGYYFDPLSVPLQVILAVIILSLISLFGFYVIPRIHLSFNGLAVIFMISLFFVIGLVNIIAMPQTRELLVAFKDGTFHKVILELDNATRITAVMTLAVNLGFIFFIILLLPNHPDFLSLLKLIIYSIVLIAFAAIAYSLIKEWPKYVSIITNGVRGSSVPESFFNNRNPYASFLLSSQVLMAFLFFVETNKIKRLIFFLLQLPFVTAITFTFSKTNVSLSYFLIIISFYQHLVRLLVQKKYTLFAIEFIFSTQIIIGFFLIMFVPDFKSLKIYDFFVRFFPEGLGDISIGSLASRVVLWRYSISLIVASPITLLVGDGPHLSRIFYQTRMEQEFPNQSFNGFGDYHNGLIEVFHTFGALGLIVYLLTILLSVWIILRRFNTNRSLSTFLLVALFIFMARGMTESLAMLLFKSEGIMASATFVLPYLYFTFKTHEFGFGKAIKQQKKPT